MDRQKLGDTIAAALKSYLWGNDPDGCGLGLADALAYQGDTTIASGLHEIACLTDHLIFAIEDAEAASD